jgi:hypothetical protein
VALHYDAYAVERGKRQHLSLDPNEGLGVVWDDDGYLYVAWAGRRGNLLAAARAALDLARALTDMFWEPALRP